MLVIVIAGTEEAGALERLSLEEQLAAVPSPQTLQKAAEGEWSLGELIAELLEVPEDHDIEGSAVAARLAEVQL